MKINKNHWAHPGSKKLLPLALLIGMLLVSACGSASVVPAAAASASGANNATTNLGANSAPAAAVAPASPASQGSSTIDCQVMGNAYMDFVGQYPYLGMASDSGFTAAMTPGSPTFIDIPKLRADFALFATLPDSTSFGKVSTALAQMNQFIDAAESNFKSGKNPFSDGSSDGQKMVALYAKLVQPYTIVAEAFGTACPNYSAPMPTSGAATPDLANDPAMKTVAAAGDSMQATISAAMTSMPDTSGTPAP